MFLGERKTRNPKIMFLNSEQPLLAITGLFHVLLLKYA
jgi:hypothetical protein